MTVEQNAPRARSAIRRIRLLCALLALPSVVFAGLLIYAFHLDWAEGILLVGFLLAFLLAASAGLLEAATRPLQTLSNVVAALREGDFSFRARGARSPDALGELATEVNALADQLQQQRGRSLEATALLGKIVEVMNAPLFAFDRGGVLRLVNEAGLRLLGTDKGTERGRPDMRPEGYSAQELGIGDLLAAEDQSIRTIGSQPNRWLVRKAIFRQDGRPHTLLLLADVSQPLQQEERLAWQRLIRVLGHELSNSLAPIKSIAGSLLTRLERLQLQGDDPSDFRRGLAVVEGRAEALHRFVEQYRALAQLPPPRLRPVPLAALVDRVVDLEQRLRAVVVPGPQATLMADPDQLEQLLINLLANAVDASLENQSDSVRVTWRAQETSVVVAIEDQGHGIANPDNLFVPFYTTKPRGSGVGLALAQQIAHAHGGEIRLENRSGGPMANSRSGASGKGDTTPDTILGARALVRLPMANPR